jgi:protein TonB
MRVFWVCLLIWITVLAHPQTVPKTADVAQSHLSIADFGLVYSLTNDWVRATQLMRKKVESADSPQNFDVLLAAVYVPKSNFSAASPFFTLRASRQPANCKKSLEAMIASSQDEKLKKEGAVTEFSANGRDYCRVNMPRGRGGHHQAMICTTTANNHLLLWNAGASNEKGLDEIVATLNSIAPLPPRSGPESSAQPTAQKDGHAEGELSTAQPERVGVASGVSMGLLIKRVNPVYPVEARAAYIQGTVMLHAEISKTGDITDLELLDGPIELAGSAVAAVRQWKYKPYLLMGQPVTVMTTIQVNYQLR